VLLQVAPALDQCEPEIGRTDIRLQAVLLEEHPLHGLGPLDAVLRRQRRAAGEVPDDGVRFGEIAVRCDFQERDLPARILGEEFRRSAFALQDVHFDQSERNAEPGQRQADLVAVAGTLIRIERIHYEGPGAIARPDMGSKVRQLQGHHAWR
jgi:hypothetical protein